MRLHPLNDTGAVVVPGYHQFNAEDDGSFDFPHEVAEQLHSTHVNGKPVWETDAERDHRLANEELKRRSDPAALYDEVRAMRESAGAPAPKLTAADLRARAEEALKEAERLEAAENDDAELTAQKERERVAAGAHEREEAEDSGQGTPVTEVQNGDNHVGDDRHSDGYQKMSVDELLGLADSKGVKKNPARKELLISRLREYDRQHDGGLAIPPIGTEGDSNLEPNLDAENVTAEPIDGTEITPENAGIVVDENGVERIGELPAE